MYTGAPPLCPKESKRTFSQLNKENCKSWQRAMRHALPPICWILSLRACSHDNSKATLKPFKCTVLSRQQQVPQRVDSITTLSGHFLSSKGTVHFYSCSRDISLHMGRSRYRYLLELWFLFARPNSNIGDAKELVLLGYNMYYLVRLFIQRPRKAR
jgi:hypothetical protein